MGGVGHVRKVEDQRTPNGQSEAQIAFGVNWGSCSTQSKPAAGEKKKLVLITLWSPDSSN
jgi:hypothetical protein